MISLQELLNQSTHRHLELMAHAHKIDFTRREAKAVGLQHLSTMLHDGAYEKAFHNLTPEHIEALQALVVGGGWLPLPLFTHYFGEIRRYRPWRQDFEPRHPWRYPASVAERLWHLGFIHIRDKEMVGIVAEVTDLLPPLPRAEGQLSAKNKSDETINERLALLRDVSILLGTLMQIAAEPIHGRWFSLAVMREVNQRLSIKEEGLNPGPSPKHQGGETIRSELQSGRLRWLHYLAQVARQIIAILVDGCAVIVVRFQQS